MSPSSRVGQHSRHGLHPSFTHEGLFTDCGVGVAIYGFQEEVQETAGCGREEPDRQNYELVEWVQDVQEIDEVDGGFHAEEVIGVGQAEPAISVKVVGIY